MNMKQYTKIDKQQGAASIIVTLILMLVITLIVLGFAQITRREQRQSLDQQLSTQAFYAAESGINDATQAIHDHTFTGNKQTCDNTGTPFTGKVDPVHNIAYTCLLISQSLSNLSYPTIFANKAISADMTFGGGSSANIIKISWVNGDNQNSTFSPDYPLFPSFSGWQADGSNTALLRLAVTDLSGGQYDRQSLDNNTFTTYLYPSTIGGGSVNFTPTGAAPQPTGLNAQGKITAAACSGGGTPSAQCTVTLNLGAPLSHVFLRIGALYDDASVTITAFNGATSLDISGAQAIIDATGKAQDVLRRDQVRLSLTPQTNSPANAVQSLTSICKQLQVNSSYGIPGTCP